MIKYFGGHIMSNNSKKSLSIFGIIVGIVIIIIGFYVQNISVDSSDANVGSSYMKFGADFYTEMYDVTRDVGLAINNAQENICNAVERICDAIGWLIISLGAIDICFFAYKFAKVCKVSNGHIEGATAEEKQKAAKAPQTAKLKTENEQLSKADVEEAASKYLKRCVSISDISCTLIYVIPQSTGVPKEMHLDMAVGSQEFTSLDLFFDESRHAYFFNGKHLALDGVWHSEKEIFGFDVALFKSFKTEVDEEG
jgi:hypothetical protein